MAELTQLMETSGERIMLFAKDFNTRLQKSKSPEKISSASILKENQNLQISSNLEYDSVLYPPHPQIYTKMGMRKVEHRLNLGSEISDIWWHVLPDNKLLLYFGNDDERKNFIKNYKMKILKILIGDFLTDFIADYSDMIWARYHLEVFYGIGLDPNDWKYSNKILCKEIFLEMCEHMLKNGKRIDEQAREQANMFMDIEFIILAKRYGNQPIMLPLCDYGCPFGIVTQRDIINPPLIQNDADCDHIYQYYSIDNQERYIRNLLSIGCEWDRNLYKDAMKNHQKYYSFILLLERMEYPYIVLPDDF